MVKIIKTLGTIYLSLILFHTVATKPANVVNKGGTQTNQQTKEPQKTQATQATQQNTVADNSDTSNTSNPLADRQQCEANTKSCVDGYSCIRFDYDRENEYSCVPNELAFCETTDECKTRIGDGYECYLPPWKVTGKKQCFTKHNSGQSCRNDSDCVNNLICSNNVCIFEGVGDLNDPSDPFVGTEGSNSNKNILGINKWVFIGAVSFPLVVLLLCIWCWLIGRSSSKAIENKKRERYEKELKEYSIPQNGASGPLYVNPQKQLEDEVGIRTFRSLFRKKKPEDIQFTKDTNNESVDISTTKVGGKAPIDTATTNDTQQKMKKSLSSTNITEKEKSSGDIRTSKKGTDVAKTNAKTTTKNATKNATKNTTKNAVKSPTPSNATSPPLSSPTGKPRATKKKAAAGKKKKTTSSNDTNTNSTSSKQSSQRGLVSSALSSAMSGQSASYFAGASPIDTQSNLYYQQMYGNPAAAAAQNQYYAPYLQNPYYAAAAAQNAAYYGQDPNLMYGAYTNTNYQ